MNPSTWEIVSTMVGLTGIGFAFFFYIKMKKKRELSYQLYTTSLIGKKSREIPEAVTLTFSDREIPQITKTTLYLWNSGNETIDRRDIVEYDPIRIMYPKDVEIIQPKIMKKTRDINKVSIEFGGDELNKAFIFFEYLDKNDGAAFEIQHTGENQIPEVLGSVKGMRKGLVNKSDIIENNKKLQENYYRGTIIVTLLALLAMIISIGLVMGLPPSWKFYLWVIFVMIVTIGAAWLTSIIILRKQHPKKLDI